MAEEVRPRQSQSPPPQGPDVAPPPPPAPKQEEEQDPRRHRPQPLELPPTNTVTLPSFREAYGSALAQYPAPPPGHLQHPPYGDPLGRPLPTSRPLYPDSPNGSMRVPAGPAGPAGLPGPPGPHGPVGSSGDPYSRLHHPTDVGGRDVNKDYYNYPYHPYADRPPPPPSSYWPQHPMQAGYQPQPPESAPRQRTSIACKYCRKRKIRCSGYQNTPDGKCTNCKKTGNDCVFQPVSSTTSTAFVPVSAIQGGVPPGTPLYGAFGQPLGPNGGRGPAPPQANSAHVGHPMMNGAGIPPPHPGYGPISPGGGGYYQQHLPPPMDPNGPPLPPASSSSQIPPPGSNLGMRQLPLPYPQPSHGYRGDDQRRRSIKRPLEDDEADYACRLPPPPPSYINQSGGNASNYYGAPDDAGRRHSPPPVHSSSAPALSASPTNSHPAYNQGPLPPPPPMSSTGTEFKQY